jgi:hypothetical protein
VLAGQAADALGTYRGTRRLPVPCVSCCVQSELEDAIFIWCAEGSTHSSSSSSSSTHPPACGSSGGSTPGALSPRAAAGAAAVGTSFCNSGNSGSSGSGPFVLDCLLPLEDTAASLAWLDTGGLPPMLAVGVASGVVEVYSRDRRLGATVCRLHVIGGRRRAQAHGVDMIA